MKRPRIERGGFFLAAVALGLLSQSAQAQTSNPSFVTSNYIALLGRNPDPAGWAYWVTALNQNQITWLGVTN